MMSQLEYAELQPDFKGDTDQEDPEANAVAIIENSGLDASTIENLL